MAHRFLVIMLHIFCLWVYHCPVIASVGNSDLLSKGYTIHTVSLKPDFDGTPVAVLISKMCTIKSHRSVLYVHGHNDYFFQDHLADWYLSHGYNFYALELRRYGHALLPEQVRYSVRRLTDYYEELDMAMDIIRNRDQNTFVLVNGHSMGGLVVALYASERKGCKEIDALYLNSPFLELNAGWFTRNIISPVFAGLGGVLPKMQLPVSSSPYYGQSLHKNYCGEWDYDLTLKLLQNKTLAGWLRAIRKAQKNIRNGLSVECPVLVMCSDKSGSEKQWNDQIPVTDVVLNVKDIERLSPFIGRHITVKIILQAKHDVILSVLPVRENAFDELEKWLNQELTDALDNPVPIVR